MGRIIPYFGIVGAAMTTVLSELIIFIGLYTYTYKKIIKLNIFATILLPVLSGGIMLVVIYLLQISLSHGTSD